MRIIDPEFRPHVWRYLGQCLLATAAVMVVLALLDVMTQPVLIASLGASAFIAFTMPHAHVSETRYLIGGYAVGVVVGVCFGLAFRRIGLPAEGAARELAYVALGGLSVGLAIFLMVITNTEHPPAAGVALGFVVNHEWGAITVVGMMGAIAALAAVKRLLRPHLINLL